MRWLRLLAVWLPAAVLISILPVYASYLVQPAAGYFHDDGVYLVNALSLASGHGFRTISLPDELFQTKYPFLYPAILAVLWKLFPAFPANLLAFKLLSMCATAGWAYASYRLALRETNDPVLARWIAVLLLTFPWVVFLSATTMPETLFALASTASLLMLSEDDPRPFGGRVILGAVLASTAFLLRSAGSALILAWLIVLLSRKHWRRTAIFATTTVALTGPWLLWQALHPATLDFVGRYYTKFNYGHLFASAGANPINALVTLATICPLGGIQFGLASTLLNLAAGLLCLIGLVRSFMHHKLTLPAVWFTVNIAMVFCWLFSPVRYQVPLYAIALVLLTKVAKRERAAFVLILALCTMINVADLFKLRQITVQQGSPTWALRPPDSWSQTIEAMAWLRNHTAGDSVVATNCDADVFLYTGRKAIRPFNVEQYRLLFDSSPGTLPLGSSERLRSHLKANRISYILMVPMTYFMEASFFREQLASLRKSNPAAFHLEKRFDDPEFYILSVDRSKL
jgi:hypothetical protein